MIITMSQKSFYEFPLRKIFKLDEFLSQESIPINEAGFSPRVQNLLEKNNINSLVELLNLSLEDISNMPGFGKNAIANLTDTLKRINGSRKKRIPEKVFLRAKDELDKFLRDAALRHDPQIDLIIAAFENFSAGIIQDAKPRNPFAIKIQALPKIIKNRKVSSLLRLYEFKNPEMFSDLPDDLTLSAFPNWLYANSKAFDENEMNNFLNELTLDFRGLAKRIGSEPFKTKSRRDIEIIRLRAQGKRLEQIGRILNLTRERVRQIESKYVDAFNSSRLEVKKLLNFLYALANGKSVLTLGEAKLFIDDEDAEIIWFLSAKTKLSTDIFTFDKEMRTFVFYEKIELDDKELLGRLPEIVEVETYDELLENLAQEKNCPVDLLKNTLARYYDCTGKIFHRIPLTGMLKFGYILKKYFPTGYRIGNENFYSRFMNYRKELFDDDSLIIQRNVDATVARNSVLCDRGKYIHPDFVNVPPEIMQRIKNFVDASDRTALFYKEIFEALKNIFIGTQITNPYFMQGAIRFYKLPYILRKDYLTKSEDMNMGKEFELFVEEHGEVTAQEIKAHFNFFRQNSIEFLIKRSPEVIRIGEGYFMHSSLLNVQDEDFEPMEEFLNQNCRKPTSSRVLFGAFRKQFADFMKRNRIQNHDKLFGILQYMFHDEFNFSRPYISTEDITAINARKILLQNLAERDEVKISELVKISDDCGVNYTQKNYLIECLFPDFIRVDESILRRPESVGVTEEIISEVVEKMGEAIEHNGGWQSVKTFANYDELPQLEIAWSDFLLENVASLAGDSIHKLKMSSTYGNFSLAIFVSEEFAEDDFASFVKKVLIAEHQKTPFRTDEEIFNRLNELGLCTRKLPKFLEDGKAFEFLK